MTGESRYTECYVAFLDILGFADLVKRSVEEPALLDQLVSALEQAKNIESFWSEHRDMKTGKSKRWSLQVHAFSDCVALFIPVESGMLSSLLASIRRLHDRLLRLDVCLRGAVTLGGMHWDDRWSREPDAGDETGGSAEQAAFLATPVAIGPGLIAAYKLESQCAVYPRILISDDLYDHAEQLKTRAKARAFPLASASGDHGALTLLHFLRQDFDGLRHLDVLHPAVNRRDVLRHVEEVDAAGAKIIRAEFDDTTREEWLQRLREFIERNLESAGTEEKIKAKYLWLARYHNATRETKRIPVFQDEVPEDGVPLTIARSKQTSPCAHEST